MTHRSVRNAITLVVVAAVAAGALRSLGGGILAAPREWSLDGWAELIRERGAAAAAMTLLRYAAFATSAYLVVLGVATIIVGASRVSWLDALLAFATPRILRPVLGIVTVVTFAAPLAAGAAETSSKAPVMVLVGASDAHGASPTTTSTTVATQSPAPTMRRVDAPSTTNGSTTSTMRTPAPTTTQVATFSPPPTTVAVSITMPPAASAALPTASTPAPKSTTPAQPNTWTIRRGEHLWHVAETVLAERLDRVPSTAEITTYWNKVIGANRDRLVDRDNPDLVFTGQELVLPPV
jgi:hypothetical protein